MHTPEATSAGVAERPRAGLRSVHGVEAWTWRCGDGGGNETASPLGPSEERTARPPETLALQSFRGTGSWSTPKITSAPAAMAPAENPPSPENRSTTFIYLSYCFEVQRRSHRSVSHTRCQLQYTYHAAPLHAHTQGAPALTAPVRARAERAWGHGERVVAVPQHATRRCGGCAGMVWRWAREPAKTVHASHVDDEACVSFCMLWAGRENQRTRVQNRHARCHHHHA
eukprot:scaffold39643_cov71-Phaeocystis_antarctica.AAC.9